MKKRKHIFLLIIVCVLISLCVLLLAMSDSKQKYTNTLEQVKSSFASDIEQLKEGKYSNLIATDFITTLDDVDEVYRLKFKKENNGGDSMLENLEVMESSIDKFFETGLDKSFLTATIYVQEEDMEESTTVEVPYDEIKEWYHNGKLKNATGSIYLFGNNTKEGGNMVQVFDGLYHVWYSKGGLGTIHPSAMGEFKKVYQYVSCVRQEDVALTLKDGEVTLSEMEQKVLAYMNSEQFPLVKAKGIDMGIGEVRIIEKDGKEAVCFLARRIYKGVPFEYGSNVSEGGYTDNLQHDGGEITYVESASPDTMLGFFVLGGNVVEQEKVTKMMTVGEALSLLSEQIGDNSIYDVYGVELVYRNQEYVKENSYEKSDIYEPKWKIITINQNDDKYTLFYVDVITGEITNRFEYYYD